MSATDHLLIAFELHSPEKIRAALNAGASPLQLIKGITPLQSLVEMYARSAGFSECVRVMLNAGAAFENPLLESILLDDSNKLRSLIALTPAAINRQMHLNCTFTSLRAVMPLHVAAEYNSVACARVLLEAGADVNSASDADGHTPLFHTVNSNANFARPMMELLVEAGADLTIHLPTLIWGEGFEWETEIYDVTPISYAQCGLYRQFHRRESDVYSTIAYLFERRYGSAPLIRNVPNKYLRKD